MIQFRIFAARKYDRSEGPAPRAPRDTFRKKKEGPLATLPQKRTLFSFHGHRRPRLFRSFSLGNKG